MRRVDDGSTRSTLLRKVADWEDFPAWVRFQDNYDPHMRRWCRRYGLDVEAIDEICQRIWVELAGRMRSFEYDPSGSFRGWLRRLCESRVLNYLREKRAHPLFSFDDREEEPATGGRGIGCEPVDTDEDEEAPNGARHLLLDVSERIQSAVRAQSQAP